ncbi:class I SAM-dependent methyltransferase [Halorussus sp. MSC15.2]|uniref:class I SAM-dependent methyltransferase n=1 Tax=Halorussus sp. MSC15.2 TaxID=2283638 RepID=UPI0013D7DD22|nr:class I SAM-dependent methyltransferase [Halorussus sp. MSC15.2]NEU57335.1 class I SAM-dependent methyltransferase [Halorussus sp. MSC15.2]
MSHALGDTATFDRTARFYDWFAPTPDAAEFRDALSFADREVERVLDVGGGTGRGASALGVSERIVADAAEGMTQQARRNGFEAVRADAATLPFAAEGVDAVLVVDALHHFGDYERAVAEAARVLRPGGVLVIREIDPTSLVGRVVEVGEHLYGFDSTFFAPEDLGRAVADAGLDARFRTSGFEYTVVGHASRE